jgi:hypothetical protein
MWMKQVLAAAENAIRRYRCQHIRIADDGDPLPLLDLLSIYDRDGTTKTGQDEMELLVDAVCGDILNTDPEARKAIVDEWFAKDAWDKAMAAIGAEAADDDAFRRGV